MNLIRNLIIVILLGLNFSASAFAVSKQFTVDGNTYTYEVSSYSFFNEINDVDMHAILRSFFSKAKGIEREREEPSAKRARHAQKPKYSWGKLSFLGRGQNGRVYKLDFSFEGREESFAVKSYLSGMGEDISICTECGHLEEKIPGVVPVHMVLQVGTGGVNRKFVFMELVKDHALPPSRGLASRAGIQLIETLESLRGKDFYIWDFGAGKQRNLLFDKNAQPILIDFGHWTKDPSRYQPIKGRVDDLIWFIVSELLPLEDIQVRRELYNVDTFAKLKAILFKYITADFPSLLSFAGNFYTVAVQDVAGDGNCGFHALAAASPTGQAALDRASFIERLRAIWLRFQGNEALSDTEQAIVQAIQAMLSNNGDAFTQGDFDSWTLYFLGTDQETPPWMEDIQLQLYALLTNTTIIGHVVNIETGTQVLVPQTVFNPQAAAAGAHTLHIANVAYLPSQYANHFVAIHEAVHTGGVDPAIATMAQNLPTLESLVFQVPQAEPEAGEVVSMLVVPGFAADSPPPLAGDPIEGAGEEEGFAHGAEAATETVKSELSVSAPVASTTQVTAPHPPSPSMAPRITSPSARRSPVYPSLADFR